jgi:hypothetical protein
MDFPTDFPSPQDLSEHPQEAQILPRRFGQRERGALAKRPARAPGAGRIMEKSMGKSSRKIDEGLLLRKSMNIIILKLGNCP